MLWNRERYVTFVLIPSIFSRFLLAGVLITHLSQNIFRMRYFHFAVPVKWNWGGGGTNKLCARSLRSPLRQICWIHQIPAHCCPVISSGVIDALWCKSQPVIQFHDPLYLLSTETFFYYFHNNELYACIFYTIRASSNFVPVINNRLQLIVNWSF